MESMLDMDKVTNQLEGRGFEAIKTIPGSSYRDCSTVIVIPTRGMINYKVVQSWQNLIAPMNQKRAILFATGDEVGRAYENLIKNILDNPELSKWKYIMTLEDDNLVPSDSHIKLLETIEWGKFDAVSGIYFTRGAYPQPMAYGDPEEYNKTGILEFKPRDVVKALEKGHIMEVNGIAMGCSLYRMDLFREIPQPWFVTVNDFVLEKQSTALMTQDLFFCEKAKRVGKRFAVDFRVKVGHLDVNTGIVY